MALNNLWFSLKQVYNRTCSTSGGPEMEGFQPDKFKMGWTRWYMTQMQWRNNNKEIIFWRKALSVCLLCFILPSWTPEAWSETLKKKKKPNCNKARRSTLARPGRLKAKCGLVMMMMMTVAAAITSRVTPTQIESNQILSPSTCPCSLGGMVESKGETPL